MPEIQQDPFNAIITEFGTRLTELEEKQRLIKDRVLLIGENLISTKEDLQRQDFEFKKQLKQINSELKNLNQLSKRIIYELQGLARKPELEILERQFKMFEPLEFARIKDIEQIVKREIKKTGKS